MTAPSNRSLCVEMKITNDQLGKVAGYLSIFLTAEIYVQDFVLRVTFPYALPIFFIQSFLAIILGVVASELHS
jgi:hypothetical protein